MDAHLKDIVGFWPFTLKVLYSRMVSAPPSSQLLRPAETGWMVLSVASHEHLSGGVTWTGKWTHAMPRNQVLEGHLP